MVAGAPGHNRFVGKNAETKSLPNGTPVTRFSVATKRSWKNERGRWQDKTQWHNVVAFSKSFAQMTDRLLKGAHVFVQGELTTREYDRTIEVLVPKDKTIKHTIRQLVVELRVDTIRILDRSSATGAQSDAAEPPTLLRGLVRFGVSCCRTGPLDKISTVVAIGLASLRSASTTSHV